MNFRSLWLLAAAILAACGGPRVIEVRTAPTSDTARPKAAISTVTSA